MRISDWSSDVCSSDLAGGEQAQTAAMLPYVRHARIPAAAGEPAVLKRHDVGNCGYARHQITHIIARSGAQQVDLSVCDDADVPPVAGDENIRHGRNTRTEENPSELQSLMRN